MTRRKMIVLRAISGSAQRGSGNAEDAAETRLDLTTPSLNEHEVELTRDNPDTMGMAEPIPFAGLEPCEDQSGLGAGEEPDDCAWGVRALGAPSSPYDGAGVSVAIIDSGVARAHPAFAGMAFDAADLKDFTKSPHGGMSRTNSGTAPIAPRSPSAGRSRAAASAWRRAWSG